MPLNATAEVETPDYSQMSLSQLASDGRISNDFKQKVQLQLQKVGFKIGLIKLSDFSRRDIAEELLYNKKKEDELRAWLEAMKYRFLNDKLETLIQDEKVLVDQEIDKINASIHKLEKSKGGAGQIDDLKRAREGLKGVKVELDGLDRERRASKNINELQEVADNAQTTKATAENVRNSMRRKRRSTPKPENIKRTANTTATPHASTLHDDDDSGEEEGEKNSAKTPVDAYAEPKIKPPSAAKPPPAPEPSV